MRRILCTQFLLLFFTAAPVKGEVNFARDIKPILEARCLKCHNPNNTKGDLSLEESKGLIGPDATIVVPGKALESELYLALIPREPGERPHMPKDGKPLTKTQTHLIRQWIDEGAKWPDGLDLREASRADSGGAIMASTS